MPMRGELQILDVDPSDRQSAMSNVRSWDTPSWGSQSWDSQSWEARSWIVATVGDPEFGMIALFCAVGLWLTFYFIHLFSLANTAGA